MGLAQSPFEISLEEQIQDFINYSIITDAIPRDENGVPDQDQVIALEKRLQKESGLTLPFLPRYLLWTFRALTFNWGELQVTYSQSANQWDENLSKGQDVLLRHLANTMMLIGTAYLITFLIAMPLSLYLARNRGKWLDRVFSTLSPISSVPSWVFAILLLTIFAVQLKWFPVSGKNNIIGINSTEDQILDLLWHMTLPVLSLVLALLFQVVYAWRTFFMIYSEEDYVELAKAKGLSNQLLQARYILRPALPYVMTSLATTVIGFWQLAVALEVIFQWPGIGWLYIKDALPNYWGDVIYTGQLMIVIEIVVIFAYVLGLVVFFLDIFYVIIDPRIYLSTQNNRMGRGKSLQRDWLSTIKAWMKKTPRVWSTSLMSPGRVRSFSWIIVMQTATTSIRTARGKTQYFFNKLRHYPSAVVGLAIIFIMMSGSAYALIALPYEQVAVDYDRGSASGRIIAPRVAAPAWTNIFRPEPLLSTLTFNENSSQTQTTINMNPENGWVEKTITITFDYRYKEAPTEMVLYFDSIYVEKSPFISLVWKTPDGRQINLKSRTLTPAFYYDFSEGIQTHVMLRQNPEWHAWFDTNKLPPTMAHYLLFAKPGMDQFELLPGTYQLEIKSLLFEKDSDFQPQLTLLGNVYGWAGTDYWRRDLTVPLLWGMPFALFVGLLGTLLTVVVAMIIPAIGVWYGGWLDDAIQRLTEINMVLPGLTIAVLAYSLFGLDIWVVLGIVVVLNSFGSPIKNFRSALLQAKEEPYIEAARSYGAGDFRIITRYLIPRILPTVIPQIVSQIPGFIFLEATLGFFNIKSLYPSWGRIIFEGLSRGAIYGSPFWVLMPIALLLFTGFSFALLGAALESILNPRLTNHG